MRVEDTADIFSLIRPPLGWGARQGGALRAAAADTLPPTKPQTLSIFSGTKHVCGMRSSTQLPLEQERGEWGGGNKVGFLVSSAAPDSSL